MLMTVHAPSLAACRGRSDPGGKCPDIGFISVGGQAHASHVEVYSMQTCWDEDPQEQDSQPCRYGGLSKMGRAGGFP